MGRGPWSPFPSSLNEYSSSSYWLRRAVLCQKLEREGNKGWPLLVERQGLCEASAMYKATPDPLPQAQGPSYLGVGRQTAPSLVPCDLGLAQPCHHTVEI